MNKMLSLTLAVVLSGLLAGPGSAGETTGQSAGSAAAQGKPAAETELVTGGVSQRQLDIMKKREEARLRRDEMLKVRAQTIKAEEEQDKARAGAR